MLNGILHVWRVIHRDTKDGNKYSFGRVYAFPFLVSSWGLSTASGIVHILHGQSVWDDVIMLATTGFALFTGSKALSIKGTKPAAVTVDEGAEDR